MADTTRRTTLSSVVRRWPYPLGIVWGAVILLGGTSAENIRQLAVSLTLLALIYLVLASLDRRDWSLQVLLGSLALLVLARLQPWVPPAVVLFAAALGAIVWGVGHGMHHKHDFRLQVAGMIGFGALAVAALLVDVDLALYLVAAGWLGHAAWDWLHVVRDRVVKRWYAECCSTLDVVVAVGLIAAALA
jgi:hypothetical protein